VVIAAPILTPAAEPVPCPLEPEGVGGGDVPPPNLFRSLRVMWDLVCESREASENDGS